MLVTKKVLLFDTINWLFYMSIMYVKTATPKGKNSSKTIKIN